MNRHTSLLKRSSWGKTHLRRIVEPHIRCSVQKVLLPERTLLLPTIPEMLQPKGFDPELLYVECGHCGAPVIWEKGRASLLLKEAGIDPIELDARCLLVTDACPMCSSKKKQYTVQIFRVSTSTEHYAHFAGNA